VPPIWSTPVCGAECHARPSAALAHLSARVKRVETVSTSCVANFSNIFSSRTLWWKAVMIEASDIRGMVPPTWHAKCRRGNSPAGWRSAPALNPKMRKGLKRFACLSCAL
jgi:hypothetical protein